MQGGGTIDMTDTPAPQNKLTLKSAITENFKESKTGTYNKQGKLIKAREIPALSQMMMYGANN